MNRVATKLLPPVNAGESASVVSYSYTVDGQLNQVQTTAGGAALRTAYYSYDALRRLQQKDVPEGVIAYGYTPDNRVQSIQAYRRSAVPVNGAVPAGATPDVSVTYGYDYAGRLRTAANNGLGVSQCDGVLLRPCGKSGSLCLSQQRDELVRV